MRRFLRYLPLSILLASCYAKEQPITKEAETGSQTSNYVQQAKAALQKDNYTKALTLFNKAQAAGSGDMGEILFQKAICAACLKKDEADDYIRAAVAFGFTDGVRLDKAIREKQTGNSLRWTFDYAMKGYEAAEETDHQALLDAFSTKPFPLHVDTSITNMDYEGNSARDELFAYFPQLRHSMFSREAGFETFPLAYSRQPEFDCFVVGLRDYYADNAPVGIYVLTLSHDGQLIDRKAVGGSFDEAKEFGEVFIGKDLKISVKNWNVVYNESKEDETPKIIRTEFKDESSWTISSKGLVQQVQTL